MRTSFKVLGVVGLALGAMLIPCKAKAVGSYYMVEFYADPGFTQFVGYKYRLCTSLQQAGSQQGYAQVITTGDCEYNGNPQGHYQRHCWVSTDNHEHGNTSGWPHNPQGGDWVACN